MAQDLSEIDTLMKASPSTPAQINAVGGYNADSLRFIGDDALLVDRLDKENAKRRSDAIMTKEALAQIHSPNMPIKTHLSVLPKGHSGW